MAMGTDDDGQKSTQNYPLSMGYGEGSLSLYATVTVSLAGILVKDQLINVAQSYGISLPRKIHG